MMMTGAIGPALRAGVLAVGLAVGMAPAVAGDAEVAALQGYVGTWGGTGVLRGEGSIERFGCRLDFIKGNAGKVNFRGSCSVRGAKLDIAGTVAWVDRLNRYEAALSSNTDFKGKAIGVREGADLVFALKDRDSDAKGNDLALKAEMVLQQRTLAIRFGAVLNGEVWEGDVGFRR